MKKSLLFLLAVFSAPLLFAVEWQGELQQWYFNHFYRRQMSVKNIPDAAAPYPAVEVEFTTPHRYPNTDTYFAHLNFDSPLDLSKMRRVRAEFQADTPQGYRSGRFMFTLTDINGKKISYLVSKEFYRAKQGIIWEHPLTGAPKDFDFAKIKKITVHGSTPSHAGKGKIRFSKLSFDDKAPFERAASCAAKFSAWQDKNGNEPFKLYAVYPDELIYPYGMDKMPTAGADELFCARGGSDDMQVMIIPGKNFSGGNVPVNFGEFTDHAGNKLDTSNFRIYRLLFVPTAPTGITPDKLADRIPDILCPVENGSITLEKDQTSAIFAELAVSRNAVPGTYRGKITIGSQKIDITLTVARFIMPERPALRTSFWIFPNRIPRQNGASGPVTLAELTPYLDAALRARVTPVLADENHAFRAFTVQRDRNGSYSVDISNLLAFYDYVINHGGNAMQAGDSHWFGKYFYNLPRTTRIPGESDADFARQTPGKIAPHRQQIFHAYLAAVTQEIEQRRWQPYAYIQLWDEANARAEKDILPVIYPLMKSYSYRLPVLITRGKIAPDYLSVIMCPTMPAVDAGKGKNREQYDAYRAKEQMFWYYGCSDFGLTLLENPIRNRLFPLYGVNAGAQGFLFWSLNRYTPAQFVNFPAQEFQGYRRPTGNHDMLGDGFLIYPPAPDSRLAMPTLRLMLFKAGMEDAELLLSLSRTHRPALDDLLIEAWNNPAAIRQLRRNLLNLSR